ncbi:MAG: tRNA (adenosine(37)-N6)-dimethylallyltransferase MiaA [Coriobacteriia bacterium]|nr:tRNA (adenosine(37)-N6)-dimethylallyltransferase MiaA [Coriobacteriia bacterium]
MPSRIIAIVGPTAVGKSAVAEHLALRLGGEIVSADSMQVYRGMDVGTAKTPARERGVPYHCIDLVDPGVPYSAAVYQRDARMAIGEFFARDAVPVIVGGTGLYVRAALDEMAFPAGDLDDSLRDVLERRAVAEGPEALFAELARLDPDSATVIHPNNVRRVVRALEMAAHGASYAEQAAGFAHRKSHYPNTILVGLTMERPVLYRRIEERVDTMVASGLLDEVRALIGAGFRDALTATQAIGYKEFVEVLEDGAPLAAAIEAVKRATRRYAKRQLTWFRADPRVHWLDVTSLSSDAAGEAAADLIESVGHTGGDS